MKFTDARTLRAPQRVAVIMVSGWPCSITRGTDERSTGVTHGWLHSWPSWATAPRMQPAAAVSARSAASFRGKLWRASGSTDWSTPAPPFELGASRVGCTTAKPSAGVVTDRGRRGRECAIVANDAPSRAAVFPADGQKHLRLQEWPSRTGCRASTWSTGGAYQPLQAEVFPTGIITSRIFFNQARCRHSASADRRRDGLVHCRRRMSAMKTTVIANRHDLHRRPR